MRWMSIAVGACVLLGGCLADAMEADQSADGTPEEGNGTPHHSQGTNDSLPPSSGAMGGGLNTTRTVIFDSCQYLLAEAALARIQLPYSAPDGWEDESEYPNDFLYLQSFQCGLASVQGITTLRNVSIGWFSHTNLSADNGELDHVAYDRLQAGVELFSDSPRLSAALRALGVATIPYSLEFDGVESATLDFEDGRVTVEFPARVSLPQSGNVDDYVDVVVPSVTPGLWIESTSDAEYRHLSAVGLIDVEGNTPLTPWWSAASVPAMKGGVSESASLEMTVHAVD